jgi:predicted O-methyltransferase YrrM
MFDKVLEEVEEQCREERVPMLGPEKAKLLASCVEKAKPTLIVECGTAIGYSGLWILRVLKNLGGTFDNSGNRGCQCTARARKF